MRGSPRRGPPASRTRDHAVVALSMVTAGLLLLAVLRPTLPGIGEKIRAVAWADAAWWPLTALLGPSNPSIGSDVQRVPGSGCNDALGVDRVALLFLMRAEAYHDELWRRWLDSAAGLLPAQALQGKPCSAEVMAGKCAMPDGANSTLTRQFLFSVYAHVHPMFSYSNDSVFFGTEIPRRVEATRLSFTAVVALQKLLASALREPRNQRFVLLSETCAPLYPPTVVYQALMAGSKSRVAACNPGPKPHRWTFEDDITWAVPVRLDGVGVKVFTHRHISKSSQWVALVRGHAELVARERELLWEGMFMYPYGGDNMQRRSRPHGTPDEWYIATLLAVAGLANETDCAGYVTALRWTGSMSSPDFYPRFGNITVDLIRELRQPLAENNRFTDVPMWSTDGPCQAQEAISLAASLFVNVSAVVNAGSCMAALEGIPGAGDGSEARSALRWGPDLLGRRCGLFARKFTPDGAAALLLVMEAMAVIPRAAGAASGGQTPGVYMS